MLIDLNLLHSELNLIVNAERQVHLVSSALFVDERDCTIENITHETTDIAVGNLQLKLSLNYGFFFLYSLLYTLLSGTYWALAQTAQCRL